MILGHERWALGLLVVCCAVALGLVVYCVVSKPDSFEERRVKEALKERALLRADEPPPFPIDVVFTWAGERTGKESNRTRFNNELKYALRGAKHCLPWARKVFVLMNPPGATPSWFESAEAMEADGIFVVDHTQVFADQERDLPTTNSNAIEFNLHRIPGLAEHFIYLNDDFVFLSPVPYTDLFTREGLPRVDRSANLPVYPGGTAKDGFSVPPMTLMHPHMPMCLLRSELEAFHQEFAGYSAWVRSITDRSGDMNNPHCRAQEVDIYPCHQIQQAMGPYMLARGRAVRFEVRVDREFRAGITYSNQPESAQRILSLQPAFVVLEDDCEDEVCANDWAGFITAVGDRRLPPLPCETPA